MFIPKHSKIRLRTANNWLSWVVVGLACYIIIFPLWPSISFWWDNMTHTSPPLVRVNNQEDDGESPPPETYPEDNTLVIPIMNLQETVYEGFGSEVLARGLWRRPATSTPGEGGNTVIAGHRFTYRGAAVFYHLDKISEGDRVVLYWEGKKYIYEVTRSYVVPPTALEVEAPTDEPRLTIYTCTPLWTSKSRLVVESKLVEVI